MNRLLIIIETIAASLLLLVVALVASNVFLRGVFGISVPDWYDGSRVLLGIAMFWGVAIATYRGSHICVDLLWESCSAANRRRIDIFAAIVCLAFFAPTAWMVWQKVIDTGSQVTADLRLPFQDFYAIAAMGATAAAVLAAARIVWLILNRPEILSGGKETHGS